MALTQILRHQVNRVPGGKPAIKRALETCAAMIGRGPAPGNRHIYAAGDCTRHPQALLGGTVRLESVHNAMTQGRVTGANLLGEDARYQEMPWFWSDQFDVKLQMVGLSQNHDQAVVRGDMDGGRFSVFYLRGGVLIAADVVNNPREFMLCRKLVPRLARVDPQSLADAEFPLQDLV